MPKAALVLKGQAKVTQRVKRKEEIAENDNIIFDKLRALRKEIALEANVPPYVIFHDSTLLEMSARMPRNKAELMNIKGVGQGKLQQYGDMFLELIKAHLTQQNSQPELENTVQVIKQQKEMSHVVTLNMLNEGLSLEDIARERKIKPSTVQDHLIRCGQEGFEINWDAFIPKEYEDLIMEKLHQLGPAFLRPVKDELPVEVDYMAIKAVIAKHKLK